MWAQDLAASTATDITAQVKANENAVVIPGAVLLEAGHCAPEPGNLGVVLAVKP